MLYLNSWEQSKDVLLENCPQGDDSIDVTGLDAEDVRVLETIVSFESLPVSRAIGSLAAFCYAKGLRDARKKATALH